MYEGVHAYPDGRSTVSRLALTAAEMGFEGVVLRNHGDEYPSYDREEFAQTYGIDVVKGVEVRAERPSRASGFVGNHRDDRTIVLVHGGGMDINRFAVEQPAVDVLAHPMAGDGDVNHVLARIAAENGVHLEWSLRDVLRGKGGRRVEAIENLRKLKELIEQYDAPYVVSGDPTNHLELRGPRDLIALGETLECSPEWIKTGLVAWKDIANRNRERASDRFVEPGVRTGRDENDETS